MMPYQFEQDIKSFLMEINTVRVCKLLQILSNFVKEKQKNERHRSSERTQGSDNNFGLE